jgi:hypothetical protein
MTGHGGRVIRTGYPCVCEVCRRVIPAGRHALWDGGATCLPCVVKAQGVVPMTEEELGFAANDAEGEGAPVKRRRGR